MKIDSYRNKFGHMKLYSRRRFWLFGKRLYYVSGCNRFYGSKIKHGTYMFYENLYTAKRMFDIVKATLMLEEGREKF